MLTLLARIRREKHMADYDKAIEVVETSINDLELVLEALESAQSEIEAAKSDDPSKQELEQLKASIASLIGVDLPSSEGVEAEAPVEATPVAEQSVPAPEPIQTNTASSDAVFGEGDDASVVPVVSTEALVTEPGFEQAASEATAMGEDVSQ